MDTITKEIWELVESINPDESRKTQLILLIENELRRRLAKYELLNKSLREKYKMSFEKFKKTNVVKKLNFSQEVESDFCDWEMAIDGLATFKKKLEDLEALSRGGYR